MTESAEADGDRIVGVIMHVAFLLLVAASLTRFLLRHPDSARTPAIAVLSVAMAGLYALGARRGRVGWLALVVALWIVLVALAPSFAWCAVPLLYTGLRILPLRTALFLVAVLTAFVAGAQIRLAGWADPAVLVTLPTVVVLATAVFVYMRRQSERRRMLIDDLIRTRRELAETERREGTLAERERLAMEIHDTLAQGLSSQRMLLQAADRIWATDPRRALAHVRSAESIAEQNLTEARQFVRDLAPADLAASGSLGAALDALAQRESSEALTVRFRAEGNPPRLPDRVEATLLRIAQGALANVREHARASTATLTLTTLDDQVVLDIADDGMGFDAAASVSGNGDRGYGLAAIRARLHQFGGTLTIESTPGEGTVLSAAIPWGPA
ncbi:sensor histidine kinase [Nocardia goodfellowii]|uniref:Oxygen sensor histidine kinase NreB n=1 Tax=Nocardia goodfellowii TaxID=882446 RepID=A0ABS4QG72_9NOCA|nr:sensor histidine kinase [Nocardia goodfellowii]MBP2190573.1 signal transduction histidine kinase [Nocardia goodfellowii]